MRPLSWLERVLAKNPQQLIRELEILRGNASCLRSDRQGLVSQHDESVMNMRNLLARLRTTNCCLSCQLRLVKRREALERIIPALEKKLNLLEGNLYSIQEKITFLEDYIPRLIEHEREMLAQEIARLNLEQEEYYMRRPLSHN
jgi:hypothetical protein